MICAVTVACGRSPSDAARTGERASALAALDAEPRERNPSEQLQAQSSSDHVARVGERVITLAEVDARWLEMDPSEQLKAQKTVYVGRRAALDAIVADILFDRAARSRGVTVAHYLNQEIAKRVQPVKPADIESFYSANQERLRGRSLDEVRPAIAEMLGRRRREEARSALLGDLRKSGPDVRIALDPPRQQVAIASTDPVRGARSAPVTIVEFSDYQCPFCARLVPVLAQVLTTYDDRVRIVWKDFPLEDAHPRAAKLAEAARCAGDYGKYWEFHDRVFSNQAAAATTSFEDYARSVGLPAAEFAACVNSGRYAKRVTESLNAGHRLGIDATPTLFINGRLMAGAEPFEVLARIIDDELVRDDVR